MSAEDKLRQIVCKIVHCDEASLTPATTWKDLKADSLDLVQIMVDVEEAFDIEIPDEEAEKLACLGDMAAFIKRSRTGRG